MFVFIKELMMRDGQPSHSKVMNWLAFGVATYMLMFEIHPVTTELLLGYMTIAVLNVGTSDFAKSIEKRGIVKGNRDGEI